MARTDISMLRATPAYTFCLCPQTDQWEREETREKEVKEGERGVAHMMMMRHMRRSDCELLPATGAYATRPEQGHGVGCLTVRAALAGSTAVF